MVVRVHLQGVGEGEFLDYSPLPVEYHNGDMYITDMATLPSLTRMAEIFDAEVVVRMTEKVPTVIVRRIK